MSKLEYAKKLAAITGKPISDFFNGTVKEESNECIKDELNVAVSEDKTTETQPANKQVNANESTNEITEELLEFQKMFAGSRIVKNKIHDGRQMTKKEYNKYIKGLNIESYFEHPLMYKMFRAEGQLEHSFIAFTNKLNRKK